MAAGRSERREMLELTRWADVVLALIWFRIVWVSGQFCQIPPEAGWNGDKRTLNARMARLMFVALGLTVLAAASLTAAAVARRSFPSLQPWVYGTTVLLALLAWPFWREVARVRAAVVRLRH